MTSQPLTRREKKPLLQRQWVILLLMAYILLTGAYLRFYGLEWDQGQHLHPDERFLTMVESAIQPVKTFGEYFDTANSSLNPHNRGYTFFVYGTFPIFIVRYVGEWLGQVTYEEIYLVGRALSALVDVLTILLVFVAASRLYDRRVGLLGASFYALAVLPIQQSHFFTVDVFINFFTFLAFTIATEISSRRIDTATVDEGAENKPKYGPLWQTFLWFGIALGMAVASKINAVPAAIIIILAVGVYVSRMPPEQRRAESTNLFAYLVLAGIVSIITFRILQPYAFQGPGFFNFRLNPDWIANLKALYAQTSGDVDFPPAIQWARRPIWFSWQNMVLWGLGLPLGVLSWVAFLWMGWRILQGEWRPHVVLWGWTALYFAWQSLVWNSTMRYQLPIYPTLAIIAGWGIVQLWERQHSVTKAKKLYTGLAWFIGVVVLVTTALWAFGFTRIYSTDHTRVAATRWIFQNIPGAINLHISTSDGGRTQMLYFPDQGRIQPGEPYIAGFQAKYSGVIDELFLPHVIDERSRSDKGALVIEVELASQPGQVIAQSQLSADQIPVGEEQADEFMLAFDPPLTLINGESYLVRFRAANGLEQVHICDPLILHVQDAESASTIELPTPPECILTNDAPHVISFTAEEGQLLVATSGASLYQPKQYQPDEQVLQAEIYNQESGTSLGTAQVVGVFDGETDPGKDAYRLTFDPPLMVQAGKSYTLELSLVDGSGILSLKGAAIANESSWDDGLPLRMDGYDPFGGIYQGGLNFEMYWDDNQEKYERFVSVLDKADYILITSSRQWGSTTRLPERYPLTIAYYRNLVGCPAELSVEACYNTLQVGEDEGKLGFRLVKVFQATPHIGKFSVNDQPAEEAFTVYDHPKVFIFAKTDEYDSTRVQEILGSVDLSTVVHVTPRQADSNPANLLLPPEHLERQYGGGTWSELYDRDAWYNRYQILGVIVWYISLFVVGMVAYPLLRLVMGGLDDRGYPLARIFGLLLLAWLSWFAASVGLAFTRQMILYALIVILVLGGGLAYIQRGALRRDWQRNRRLYLAFEGLFFLFFITFLLIRWGNPDLWHPWKGGEKPMDFSYFNAVLKSTTFPPYDPWFAGGYINYYYYGFVIVGVLVKLLGIVPSFAYNLILPSLFAMTAMGAFSIAWNLMSGGKNTGQNGMRGWRWAAGIAAALAMAMLGNLGIWRMLYDGFRLLGGVPVGADQHAGIIASTWAMLRGFVRSLGGATLPYRMDEWYWNPSRAIGGAHGDPITEFPFFTFLYADLHAHMIAMPIYLLVIAWAVGVIRSKVWQNESDYRLGRMLIGLFVGGLAIGALYPTNLSDYYTYLPLGLVALGYACVRYLDAEKLDIFPVIPKSTRKWVYSALVIFALAVLSRWLYYPYWYWYAQGYSKVGLWSGSHTPLSDYLIHWGWLLFIIVAWMFDETIDWMANTPVSALSRLREYRTPLILGLVCVFVLMLLLGVNLRGESAQPPKLPIGLGVHIVWLVLPLGVWAGLLMLRPGQEEEKRFVLFLIGTALMLTLLVEIVVVQGDIGRMNTVFKFYLQAWAMLAIAAGAGMVWTLQRIHLWRPQWSFLWNLAVFVLVGLAALYPLLATMAKVRDRMAPEAPHTLDGMQFMQYAKYYDLETELDLSEDYAAIRWMQENIVGTPVIVEANMVEYRWGTRYTIYTGLPGVVGWNWHQRQQRTITPHEWVFRRVDEVNQFYETTDTTWAEDFLRRYGVSYIIVGQLERAKYGDEGIAKFEQYNGSLWDEVYREGSTVIYRVIDQTEYGK